jgi:CHAT domain-containing protein/Tfp pilus assembly protein PilF
MLERGAGMARREERAHREFVSDEQRRQPGCPAQQAVVIQRGQATSSGSRKMKVTCVILALVSAAAIETSTGPQTTLDVEQQRQEIRVQISQGHYSEAETHARALLAALGGLSGPNQLEVDRAGDLLVEALTRNGHGSDVATLALAEQLARRRDSALKNDSHALATALRNFGDVLFQAGNYPRAAAELERAVRVRDAIAGADDPRVADDLDRLALALSQIGRQDEALGASNRALAIKEKALERGDPGIARTLETRSLIWQRKSDYSRARSDLERALAIRQELDPGHPEVATTLMRFGYQFLLEGDVSQAQQSLERAVSVAEGTLRPGHPDVASLLRTLAIPVQYLGDLTRARALQERALSIAEVSLGREHPIVADCLNDLAATLEAQGDYAAARPLYERAISTYEGRLGPNYPGITTVVHNLAILNAKLGDFTRARILHQRAVDSWQRVLGSEHAIVAVALWEFGQTLAEQGLDREAQAVFERVLGIRRRTLGSEHPRVAETLSSLSNSLARRDQSTRALELSQQALDIWERVTAPEAKAFATSLFVHARILAARADYTGAIDGYHRALQIRLAALGASHPAVAEVEAARASALAHVDRRQEALKLALHAEETGRNHLRLLLGSLAERQAIEYASNRPQGLGLALSLVPDTDSGSSVLDALIRGRSLVLDEMASRSNLLTNERASPLAPLWAALRTSRQRLANLVIRGPIEQRPDRYASLVDEAQREKESAERALAEQSAVFRSELSRAGIGLEQVRASLPQGSALVSIVRYNRSIFSPSARAAPIARPAPPTFAERSERSYLAFVMRPDSSEPAVVPLGSAATIDALVTSWRREMIGDITGGPGTQRSGPSFRAVGDSLRQKIWDPVALHLHNAQRVFVVPDGALNLVPLTALPVGRDRYLIEEGPVIHYLSAERDLAIHDGVRSKLGTGLLAIGGPAFADGSSFSTLVRPQPVIRASSGQANPAKTSASGTSTTPIRRASSNCSSFQSMQFGALPESQGEAEVVANLWKRFQDTSGAAAAQALTGADATERAFKQFGPGRRILHVATHGFFLSDDCAAAVQGTRSVGGLVTAGPKTVARPTVAKAIPMRGLTENPLLLSGLALAGANRRAAAGPDEEDGILTAEEVAALNLEGVEWAVLSACDTGLGTVAGGEGVFGLRRAFQIAGVRTVIMSLWSIDDLTTREWMAALYRARLQQKLDTAESVRAASQSILLERRAKDLSTHPFYWAAFVAAGAWR